MAKPTPSAPTSTRERLLDAAAELFYREGIGVGTEALCRAAGVSKRSMYQLFSSKEELMAASLEHSAPVYQASLLPAEDDDRSPRARILYVFEQLEKFAAGQDFQGCPLLSIATELKSPRHPASVVARQFKNTLTAFLEKEARTGGAKDPVLLARQLTIAFDGASARAVMQGEGIDGLAVATASALLDGVSGLPCSLPDTT
ncbi:TetR/AcrR family transcriptional regulator [Streptomyces sp. NPDC005794]|uniref:TetR/AcrR family transcriptional regulator n=1 Tax=Streptomyces sp. NPDC005794 TaxID=3364733 RepID=UPI003675B815